MLRNTVKSLRVLRLASQLMLCASTWRQVPPAEYSYTAADDFTFRLYGLNFDCVTCNNAFNCTNNFFDPYLPIHYTTFIALRFVLRPFSGVYSQNFQCKAFLGRNFSVRKC